MRSWILSKGETIYILEKLTKGTFKQMKDLDILALIKQQATAGLLIEASSNNVFIDDISKIKMGITNVHRNDGRTHSVNIECKDIYSLERQVESLFRNGSASMIDIVFMADTLKKTPVDIGSVQLNTDGSFNVGGFYYAPENGIEK